MCNMIGVHFELFGDGACGDLFPPVYLEVSNSYLAIPVSGISWIRKLLLYGYKY